jgi:hypothetical protein
MATMSTVRIMVPATRSEGLLVEQVGQEVVIYDTASKEAHCLKGLAAVVFSHADAHPSVADLARTAAAELGEPVTEAQIADAVAQLSQRGLMETPLLVRDGLSRRELVRRSAFVGTAAFATPLITSIVAPTAAMAASGVPTGCTGCGQNKDCASNHCCQPQKDCNDLRGCCVGANNSCQLLPGGVGCTVVVAGCGTLACPPGSIKCCT